MKIYDCFPFFNELDLLEIRLNEMNEIVDYFVIVESEKTHQNEIKKLFYLENSDDYRFSKFKDKIIHVTIKSEEFTSDTWYNERLQFSSILRGLTNAEPEDFVIIGAADEIPKKSTIERLINQNFNSIGHLQQMFFYFYLDTKYRIASDGDYWVGNCVSRKKHIENNLYEVFMRRQKKENLIDKGGWHFSFMGDFEHAYKKINSYAHDEFKYISKEEMKSHVENLRDPLGRSITWFTGHENIENLPKYVGNNLDKFKKNLHQLK